VQATASREITKPCMHFHTYVRRHRKKWALSQEDLARFLALTQSSASRIESGESAPDLNQALALQVIFARSPRALFPALYDAVEEAVMAVAAEIDRELEGKTDHVSIRKQELLAAMSLRSKPSPETL
jgi:transcriptional regulator with XRE-family HTH domain